MKKADTWMPLYIGDYLADTSRLTTEQHGAYLLLLMDYWRNGPPPDDEGVLASIAKLAVAQWRKHVTALRQFFSIEGGKWLQKRADSERSKATDISGKRVAAGKQGAAKRHGKRLANAKQNGEQTGKQNATPSPSPKPKKRKPPHPPAGGAVGFEDFWRAWPKHDRKVAKPQCQAKWEAKGCDAIAERVIAAVVAAKAGERWAKDGGEFIPSPLVWLNQERWEAHAEQAEAWHETAGGIKGRGLELGIPYTDEDACKPWVAYRARVFMAAGFREAA